MITRRAAPAAITMLLAILGGALISADEPESSPPTEAHADGATGHRQLQFMVTKGDVRPLLEALQKSHPDVVFQFVEKTVTAVGSVAALDSVKRQIIERSQSKDTWPAGLNISGLNIFVEHSQPTAGSGRTDDVGGIPSTGRPSSSGSRPRENSDRTEMLFRLSAPDLVSGIRMRVGEEDAKKILDAMRKSNPNVTFEIDGNMVIARGSVADLRTLRSSLLTLGQTEDTRNWPPGLQVDVYGWQAPGVVSPESAVAEKTMIIQLEHLPASSAADVLRNLFPSPPNKMRIGTEPSTNTLILRGPTDQLEEFQAILLKLDQPAREPRQAVGSSFGGAGTTQPDSEVRAYPLRYVLAQELAPTLRELYAQNIKVTVNERTNSLLVFAPPETLGRIEDLVRKMDQPADTIAATRHNEAAKPQAAAEAEREYAAAERQAAALALRFQKEQDLRDARLVAEMKSALRKAVSEAFEKRQLHQRMELELIRASLKAIQHDIDRRERIREAIIDRRVEELLKPELRWDRDKPLAAPDDDGLGATQVPPPVDGIVTAVDKDNLEISLGSDDGLRVGQRLEVFRDDTNLGHAVVQQIDPDRAVAKVDDKTKQGAIKVGDGVAPKLNPQTSPPGDTRDPQVDPGSKAEQREAFVTSFPDTVTEDVRTQEPNPETSLQQFVDISPDERFAATVQNAEDGKSYALILWERDSGHPIRRTERPGTAATVRFAESGRILGVHKVFENAIDLYHVPAAGRFMKALVYPSSQPWQAALNEYALESPVWLGVGMHGAPGEVKIMSVKSGTGAEMAGLREGDRILALDGHTVSEIQDVVDRTMWRSPGEEVTLKIGRGNEVLMVKVELASFVPTNSLPEPIPSPASFDISGIVLDPQKKPIADADIRLLETYAFSEKERARTSTDREGKFAMKNVPQDQVGLWRYTLAVSAPSLASRVVFVPFSPKEPVHFELQLSAPAALRGRVVDADGRAVEGAMLWTPPLKQPVPGVHTATSDVNGFFQIADLDRWIAGSDGLGDGKYLLRLHHPKHGKKLVPYNQVPASISIRFNSPMRLSGQVFDQQSGLPVGGAVVRAAYVETMTNADGRYELIVQPMDELSVQAELKGNESQSISVTGKPGAAVTLADLFLRSPQTGQQARDDKEDRKAEPRIQRTATLETLRNGNASIDDSLRAVGDLDKAAPSGDSREAEQSKQDTPVEPDATVAEATVKVHQIAWGEVAEGLQAGIGFLGSDRARYRPGDTIPMAVILRNVSGQPIDLKFPSTRLRYIPPRITPEIDVRMPPMSWEYPSSSKQRLAAGEEVTFDVVQLVLARDQPGVVSTPHVVALPGEYTIQYIVPLTDSAVLPLPTGELRCVVVAEAVSRHGDAQLDQKTKLKEAFVSRFPHTVTGDVRTQEPNPETSLCSSVSIFLACTATLVGAAPPVDSTSEAAAIDALERLGVATATSTEVIAGEALLTDNDVALLKQLPLLKSLVLYVPVSDSGKVLGPSPLSDEGLRHLTGLPTLERLELSWTSIGDGGLAHLRPLNLLRHLELQGTRVTDKGLDVLLDLHNLERLNLNNTAVSDAGLRKLASVKRLRELKFVRTRVSDDGLVSLKELPKLERIQLGGPQITDTGMAIVKELESLRELQLHFAAISDDGLAAVGQMQSLQSLVVQCRDVTDEGVKHLKSLRNLEVLSLGTPQLTDTGLMYLREMKSLKRVFISAPKITEEGIKNLQRTLPAARIRHLSAADWQVAPAEDVAVCDILPTFSSPGGAEMADENHETVTALLEQTDELGQRGAL